MNMRVKGPAAALFALIALLQAPVIFSHPNYLLTWFNIDDGYYYFVTARNIAHGLGITFDGIAASNGFHPLWMFAITPIFLLPGLILPLRALAALLVLLNAGTAVLVFRLANRRLSTGVSALTALAFALLPPIHNFTARGGMESGLSAFMAVLLLDRLASGGKRSARPVLALGTLAALTFLARLDFIFLAGFVGLALVLHTWQPVETDRSPWRWRARQAALFFGPLLAVLAAYMLWNQVAFGTPTPVSGQVKRWWGTLPNTVYGFPPKRLVNVIGQFVTDDPDLGPWSLLTAPLYSAADIVSGGGTGPRRIALAGMGLALVLAAGLLLRSYGRRAWPAVRDLGLLPLLAGCLVQIGYYKLSGSVAQRPWYWIGEELWLVLACGLLLDAARVRIEETALSGVLKKVLAWSAAAALGAALISAHLPRLDRIFSSEIANAESYYLQRSSWLEEHTEPGALIGMTGSGSSAYYTDGRVFINLDGLINSYEYLEHLKAGTASEYLDAIGLDYVFGNAYIITESDPYGGIFSGRLDEADVFRVGDRELILWHFLAP